MKQQPDELFRNKLENYQQNAPSGAWEKIGLQQATRKAGRRWIRVAASLLLVASAATYGWYQFGKQQGQPSLAEIRPQAKPDAVPTPPQTIPPPQEKIITNDNPTETGNAVAPKKTVIIEKAEVQPKEELPISSVDDGIPDATVSIAENMAPASIDAVSTEDQSLPVSPTPKSLTLVFTASDVNDYKEKSEHDATSDDKKPSTLKKLLMKANDLTNNQDPLGDLRQKKNEILALNFKSDKQRGQNK
jgi:hypothetical protein